MKGRHAPSMLRRNALPLGACLGALALSLLALLVGVSIGHRYVTVNTAFSATTKKGPTQTVTETRTHPGKRTTQYATRYLPQPTVTVTRDFSRPRATVTSFVPGPTVTVTEPGFNPTGSGQ